jgi:large subunit ribosomal protein L24
MKKRTGEIQKRGKKIRKGDRVVVICGTSKGQSGTVLRMVENRVIVQGLNLKKKHVKPSQQNPKGGIVEIEAPINISNVAPCDETGKKIKLKVSKEENGDRVLYWMKGDEKVIYRAMRAPK